MKAKLFSYTKVIPELDDQLPMPMDIVAYCARVSNPGNQMNKATSKKLIDFLIKNAHWSPLEMFDATFEIEIERDIARQILRHNSFRFQEFSQRYAEIIGFSEPREARMQDPKNRQSSLPCVDTALATWWHYAQTNLIEHADRVYREALGRGIAKEVARVVLPEGLTMSRLYMKGSLRSWIHYLQLRSANGTQKEHSALALEIAKIIAQEFQVEV